MTHGNCGGTDRAAFLKSRGYSGGSLLLEYLVSVMLLATTAITVATLIMTFSTQTKGTKFRTESNALAGALKDQLANYVAENRDPLIYPNLVENPPGDPAWHLPGDDCGPDCEDNCWALEACTHDITKWLPEKFRTEHGATASYEVTETGADDLMVRSLKISINETASKAN